MKFAIALLCAVALCHVHAAPTQVLISSSLVKAASEGPVDIMVVLKEPVAPVINKINSLKFVNSAVKTTALVSQLRELTQTSQSRILAFLREQRSNIQVKPFWITNKISVKGANLPVIEDLANIFSEQIAEIREAKVIHLEDVKPEVAPAPQALEWGVQTIQADQAWDQGVTGRGVVVSSIDTGVRATHVVLADGMRQSYNWFDGTSALSQVPEDTNGHGTHTMGTIAGATGTGVAPGSKWVHCRAFEGGSATEEALLICGQWITCPTLPDGREEDCGQKPQVCSNSWGGGNEDAFYNDVIDTWQASSIVPVFAIGNSGPLCRTAGSPGDQPNVISVGATNAQNLVVSFSSHGPSRTALRIKPECSAPGNNIRSASNLGDRLYSYLSGTSMACPHVAGAVALLLEKKPDASFQEVSDALFKATYRPDMPDIACPGGGVNATYPWPNNSHGWGNVRVNDALGQL